MTVQRFPLPDVGEGLTEAEIVSWRVQPGDEVALNQVICEIETAKSLVELPSPFAGVVVELLAAEGATVEVGAPILAIEVAETDRDAPSIAPTPAAAEAAEAVTDVVATVAAEEGSGAVLVGYGSAGHVESRRRRLASAVPASAAAPVIAKPPIRNLARELDVDLSLVMPTGLAGEILREDVIRHAEQAKVFHNLETPQSPTEREERIPVKGMRKAIATAMVSSKFTAPHVSEFTDVNATRTMELVKRLKASPDFAGVKVSPLLIMAKAVIWAIRRNPMVNSTWTDEEIIVHNYVNLGIAAATPRGLIVPNIKDAQDLSMLELANALEQLTLTAREGRTSMQDMQRGTVTITNVGSFGVDTGTAILNPGEVTIMVLGAIRLKPWVVDGEVRPAYVTTVSGAFDHRVVDGDVISRFISDVAAVIEEPALLVE